MRVISKKKLVDFYESPNMERSKTPLQAWYQIVSKIDWAGFADVKKTFGASVDLVGDCIVFDIHGNHFRLITRLRFISGKVFILKVLTHKEYDKDSWKRYCGCFEAPPARQVKKVSVLRKRKRD